MAEITAGVSWIAVVVGTAVAFALGSLWFSSKMFGTKWLQGVGVSSDDQAPVWTAMMTQMVGTFLLAWVIAVTAVANALLTAILIVLAIVFLHAANGFFVRKSTYAIVVEQAYIVAMAVIMIMAQAIL